MKTIEELEALLEEWIVVKDQDDNYRITLRKNFETMDLCRGYGEYGKPIDCNYAECWSFNNTDSYIYNDFEDALKKAGLGHAINSDCSRRNVVELIRDNIVPDHMNDQDWEKVKQVYNELLAQEVHTQVTGWTYWDGSNHRTVCISSDSGDPDMYEISKEKQKHILNEMPESMPRIEGADGYLETEHYRFEFSRSASMPWHYVVIPIN